MKKVKISIMILIMLTVVGIVAILEKLQKVNNNDENNQIAIQEVVEEEKVNYNVVTNSAMYFTVESCIDTYIDYIENTDEVSLYKLLNTSYIEKNNITEDNVLKYTGSIPKGCDFDVQKMLIANGEEEDIQQYYVYGQLRYNNGQNINRQKMYLTVNIDLKNMAFNIIPNAPDEEVFDEK